MSAYPESIGMENIPQHPSIAKKGFFPATPIEQLPIHFMNLPLFLLLNLLNKDLKHQIHIFIGLFLKGVIKYISKKNIIIIHKHTPWYLQLIIKLLFKSLIEQFLSTHPILIFHLLLHKRPWIKQISLVKTRLLKLIPENLSLMDQ